MTAAMVDVGRRAWGYRCGSCGWDGWMYLVETLTSVLALHCPACRGEWWVDSGFRVGWWRV